MSANVLELYRRAAIEKWRFTGNGELTVENLHDLSLARLDTVAIGLHNELTATGAVSFVTARPRGSDLLEAKLELVKSIIADKQEAAARNKSRSEAQARLAMLKGFQAEQELDSLRNLSPEDLAKAIADEASKLETV